MYVYEALVVLQAEAKLPQVLLALSYLDTLGIVHGDIRSDNLLINSQGLLKIGKIPLPLSHF